MAHLYKRDQGFDWDDIFGCGEYILNDMDSFLSQYDIREV